MKSFEDRLEVLKKILLQAYHEKEKPEFGPRWHIQVMQRIMKFGPLQPEPEPLIQFGQFVWRLTPVACLLIAASAAVLLNFDFTPEYTVLLSFITDAEEISLVQLLPI